MPSQVSLCHRSKPLHFFIFFLMKVRGVSICPEWLYEMCCVSCSCASCVCVTHLAQLCDFDVPTKHSCLDACCPTKEVICFRVNRGNLVDESQANIFKILCIELQRCDDTFCCCMNQIPGGALCDDCTGPECQVFIQKRRN